MTDNIKSLVERLNDRATYPEAAYAPHTPSSVQLLKDAAARIAELEANAEGWHRAASNNAMWLGLSPAMGASEMQEAARARIAANGAEPVVWFGGNNYCTTNREIAERFNLRPAYAAHVASGPRYDWTTSGMKQSETGNWVMAGEADSAVAKA